MANRLIKVFGIILFPLSIANAETTNRLSAKIVDLGRVYSIHMVPGMATVIETPGPVTDAIPGDSKTIKFLPVGNAQNEVRMVLAHGQALPTNLIIRAGGKRYVFDVVPSRSTHQDIVQIMNSYGGPGLEDTSMELIATTSKKDIEKGVKK